MKEPYQLVKHAFKEAVDDQGHSHVVFQGTLRHTDTVFEVSGEGNGPIDAFFNAIKGEKMSSGPPRRSSPETAPPAASRPGASGPESRRTKCRRPDSRRAWTVRPTAPCRWKRLSHNINLSPLRAILSAINRAKRG